MGQRMKLLHCRSATLQCGTLCRIRTCCLRNRSPALCPLELRACMAQDGGVDPHSVSAAHGFLDRCRSRPASSCLLEVPARFERAIADLQSAAFPLGYGTVWRRAEDLNLFRPGQSRSCCRYTSPVWHALQDSNLLPPDS